MWILSQQCHWQINKEMAEWTKMVYKMYSQRSPSIWNCPQKGWWFRKKYGTLHKNVIATMLLFSLWFWKYHNCYFKLLFFWWEEDPMYSSQAVINSFEMQVSHLLHLSVATKVDVFENLGTTGKVC